MTKKEAKRIAIDNLESDISILALNKRLNKDNTGRKNILIEKLYLLYTMDIINLQICNDYIENIKSL